MGAILQGLMILAAATTANIETENRIDADLNGDGIADTISIQRGEDSRELKVVAGRRTVGRLTLDPYPLGPAGLKVSNGVLLVDDLTGGTTALSVIYRYRFTPVEKRMRLIGLDVKSYSRTNNHGWRSVSWNLLTGARIDESAELVGKGEDAAYGPTRTRRSRQPSGPVYMETTPDPESLFDLAADAR